MVIYTHIKPDLDAVCSVWAARRFVPGANEAAIKLVPANWDGEGMGENDLALDIEAGGRGIKGMVRPDGSVGSCFAMLMEERAEIDDYLDLIPVLRYVDAQDSYGNPLKTLVASINKTGRETLIATGLHAVLRALQAVHPNDDCLVMSRMHEILDGMLELGRSRRRAVRDANRAQNIGGKVAIMRDAKSAEANSVLFERGFRAVVYSEGNNLGVVRHNAERLRMDHGDVRAVVAAAGEADEWFAHSSGFLYCRGSRKAPAMTPSKVDPVSLARAVAGLL